MGLKLSEIREMGMNELNTKLFELRTELSKQKAQASSGGRTEKPSKIKLHRRTIARILTIMNEKKNSQIKAEKTEGRK